MGGQTWKCSCWGRIPGARYGDAAAGAENGVGFSAPAAGAELYLGGEWKAEEETDWRASVPRI